MRTVSRWAAVDWLVAGYASFVALFALVHAAQIPSAPFVVTAHVTLLVAMALLPPRGAAWEPPRPGDAPAARRVRGVARFLRYTYPALLLTPFFEEVALTVNASTPESPFWFEPHLVAEPLRANGIACRSAEESSRAGGVMAANCSFLGRMSGSPRPLSPPQRRSARSRRGPFSPRVQHADGPLSPIAMTFPPTAGAASGFANKMTR